MKKLFSQVLPTTSSRFLILLTMLIVAGCLLLTAKPAFAACPDGKLSDGTINYIGTTDEVVCGLDFSHWKCTAGGGWVNVGGSCVTGGGYGYSCPNGDICGGGIVTGIPGQVVCSPKDLHNWQCTATGWAQLGACTCSIGGGGGGGSGGTASLGKIAPLGLPTTGGNPSAFVAGLVRNGILFLMLIAFIAAFIWIILAGLKFITGGGDAKQVEAAKSQITWGIVGLFVVLLSYAIIRVVEIFFKITIISGPLTLPQI